MNKPWRPVDHPAPQPYAERPYVPPAAVTPTGWRELGDPVDWLVLAAILIPLVVIVLWGLWIALTVRR